MESSHNTAANATRAIPPKTRAVPGRFGAYGGRYVPETLMAALQELEAAYAGLQHAGYGDDCVHIRYNWHT